MNSEAPEARAENSACDFDVIIVGGGPAGSSAAISLAEKGVRVLLLEEKRMPREKLCGEFITPECFPTLKRLGVMEKMIAAGAQKITRLSLCVSSGKAVHTKIAKMSDEAEWAMSLSRARFDHVLFERAREAGAVCLEGMAVKQTTGGEGAARGVEAMSLAEGNRVTFEARLIIDASGRNSRLMVSRDERIGGRRGSRLYALKCHLKGVKGIGEQVELYFFPQGYGGLSLVEDGLVNLCFIASESAFKAAGGEALKVVEQTVRRNALARERLACAEVVGKWLSVGPLTFGPRRLSQSGVLAVGDASGMIDPFTGTGIQIALRTGELAAEAVANHLERLPAPDRTGLFRAVLDSYKAAYGREFGKRMRVAGVLRNAAFSPTAAGLLAEVLAVAPGLTRRVLRATRAVGN